MKTVRNARAALAIVVLGTFVAQSAWACKAPTSPKSIPDGRNAAVETMRETKRQMEVYLQGVADYTNCEKNALKLQEVLARQDLVMERYVSEVRKFNQARSLKVVDRR